eukprot:4797695-Pyramimonas_sp.AAC.1
MEKSSKLLLAKLLLLFLNFVFLGFAIALIVLAFSHSHYTTLLANIYASGTLLACLKCVAYVCD